MPTSVSESCSQLDLIRVPGGAAVVGTIPDDETVDFVRRQSARAQYVTSVCTGNVAGFVIYSNEPHPLKIAHDDRRFRVVSNFGEKQRSRDYYANAVALLQTHWAMIGEWLIGMKIGDADLAMLKGNAPQSAAKARMAQLAWERAYLDIVAEIESDSPPPGYLPVATTTDIIKWLKADELPLSELPNRLDFPAELHRLGARPLSPAHDDPKKANPIMGQRLWRIARVWTDQGGVSG
jgi:hypothetical protein